MDWVPTVLLWGALIFLMMRFGCGAHMSGHGHGANRGNGGAPAGTDGGRGAAGAERPTWEAPEKDVDPVCGKSVSTADARPSLHDGQVYYFCSRECREAFEVLPEDYVGPRRPPDVRRLDHTPFREENPQGGSHDSQRHHH